MSVIYLNNGHTPRSPGGVFGGRTEYALSKRLITALSRELTELVPAAEIRLSEGTGGIREASSDSLLFVFHKGTHMKNQMNTGAEVLVREEADAHTQYEAYRILNTLCADRGFRYRGVHPLTAKSPFKTFSEYAPRRSYIIKTGFIDNEADCLIAERENDRLARGLSQLIAEIYKEKKNEDNC